MSLMAVCEQGSHLDPRSLLVINEAGASRFFLQSRYPSLPLKMTNNWRRSMLDWNVDDHVTASTSPNSCKSCVTWKLLQRTWCI